MSTQPAGGRQRVERSGARGQAARWSRGRPADRWRVRARTVTCGVGLAGVLLLGMALIGGVGDPPDRRGERAAPEHAGPLTAVQPQLQRALLASQEVPGSTAPTSSARPPVRTAAPEPTRAEPAAPAPDRLGRLDELCRALLADPAGLAGLWGQHPPQQASSQQTRRRGGAVLHQMLGVFDAEQAPAAYRALREAAGGCDRLPVTLTDGTPVTVLLHELAGRRAESGRVPGGDGYAVALTVRGPEGTRTGWLALDRVGPVVSVLRHLTPVAATGTGGVAELAVDLARTRRAALVKLAPVLEVLRDRLGRAG